MNEEKQEKDYREEILRMLAKIHSAERLRLIWAFITNMKKD